MFYVTCSFEPLRRHLSRFICGSHSQDTFWWKWRTFVLQCKCLDPITGAVWWKTILGWQLGPFFEKSYVRLLSIDCHNVVWVKIVVCRRLLKKRYWGWCREVSCVKSQIALTNCHRSSPNFQCSSCKHASTLIFIMHKRAHFLPSYNHILRIDS